jgi:hypothetical protein
VGGEDGDREEVPLTWPEVEALGGCGQGNFGPLAAWMENQEPTKSKCNLGDEKENYYCYLFCCPCSRLTVA